MLEVTPSTPPASADQTKPPVETDKTSTASEQAKTTEQQKTGIEHVWRNVKILLQ
jgi:hypothetical protein